MGEAGWRGRCSLYDEDACCSPLLPHPVAQTKCENKASFLEPKHLYVCATTFIQDMHTRTHVVPPHLCTGDAAHQVPGSPGRDGGGTACLPAEAGGQQDWRAHAVTSTNTSLGAPIQLPPLCSAVLLPPSHRQGWPGVQRACSPLFCHRHWNQSAACGQWLY